MRVRGTPRKLVCSVRTGVSLCPQTRFFLHVRGCGRGLGGGLRGRVGVVVPLCRFLLFVSLALMGTLLAVLFGSFCCCYVAVS